MKTTISSKGQIVLPAELREQDRIQPGEQFNVERVQAGQYLLKKLDKPDPGEWFERLLACPEKGWFRRIPSQSTADL